MLLGLAAAAAIAAALVLQPSVLVSAREQAVDRVSQMAPRADTGRLAVIDIDEQSAASLGVWPWPREQTARLVSAAYDAGAAGVALDIVLSGNCGAGKPGNAALAAALARGPSTLGFVLPGADEPPVSRAPVLSSGRVKLPALWSAPRGEFPCPEFVAAAEGLGAASLAGEDNALVRTVPGLVEVGGTLFPGLAADAVRLAGEASALIVSEGPPARLGLGDISVPLPPDASLRLRASPPDSWAVRTISAAALLAGGQRLDGKIALIGVSIPDLGTLRPTAATPLAPSAQIEADAISDLLAGSTPWRPQQAPLWEAAAALIGALFAVAFIFAFQPLAAALAVIATAAAVPLGAGLLYHRAGLVLDPLWPAIAVAAAGIVAGLSNYAATRTAEAAIRKSFEQRLPPAVVAQLAKSGAGLRLARQERTVTALFTDIEGFTRLTAAAGPAELVKLLDAYFDGVTGIVTAHGGMIDKIVGDAVHAFFNMPLPLAHHEERALACAEAILAFSREFQATPDAARHGFGRTRIGIETGKALVGDVGAAGKFDYSAHGEAVNLAARLQDANKRTGTSVLAGPGIRAAAPPGWRFESRGVLDMAGIGPVEVFEPKRG